jgi:hypothetical protein
LSLFAEASDGDIAVEWVKAQLDRWNVILMDKEMPVREYGMT